MDSSLSKTSKGLKFLAPLEANQEEEERKIDI
jgi:hypothetical protein